MLIHVHRTPSLCCVWTTSTLILSKSRMLRPSTEITFLAPSVSFRDIKLRMMLVDANLPPPTGRIAGQDGKTKFTIENASRTRIILADTYVVIPFSLPHSLTKPPCSYSQQNSHSGFLPKYKNRTGRHCLPHPRLPTWKGLCRVEDRQCSHEAEGSLISMSLL